MSDVVRYLTHPQVQIDRKVLVPDWGLSEIGQRRTEHASSLPALKNTTKIICSGERKAIETAEILAAPLGIQLQIRPDTHENDRSSTGFLPPDKFEETANLFFGNPTESIFGWERAIDAQIRIVKEVEAAVQSHVSGDLLFVGHGGVGTLLYCHYAGVAISRAFDQPAGGGNFFSVELTTRTPLHPWRPMEKL